MSQDMQQVSLEAPRRVRPWIFQGTVANQIIPLLKKIPEGGVALLEDPSLTISWSMGPGKAEGREIFYRKDGVVVGEIASPNPDHFRAFRFETPCLRRQLVIHIANGEAWPAHLQQF